MKVLDWMADMLGLPKAFKFSESEHGGGVIQGTASEATLVALLAARSKALNATKTTTIDLTNRQKVDTNNNNDDDADDPARIDKLVGYCSDLAHSSVERAGLLGGCTIKAVQSDDECSLRGEALRAQVLADLAAGYKPFIVVATLGTTSVCSYDNLEEIGLVCREFNLWLHVDAAYAGNSFVCPENRRFMKGIEYADSFDVNPHKWLQINFDCSTFFIRDSRLLVDAFNVDPLYLKHDKQGQIPDYRHWQIPLGRRFRSLKVWFVVRSFGVAGLQGYIRNVSTPNLNEQFQ